MNGAREASFDETPFNVSIGILRSYFHRLRHKWECRKNVRELLFSQTIEGSDQAVEFGSQPSSFCGIGYSVFVATQTNVSRQVIKLGRSADELCSTVHDWCESSVLLGQTRDRKLINVKKIQCSRNFHPE